MYLFKIVGYCFLIMLFSQCKEKIDENRLGEAYINGTKVEFITNISPAADYFTDHFGVSLIEPDDGKSLQKRIGFSIFPLELRRRELCDRQINDCINTPPDADFMSINYQIIDLDAPVASWWSTEDSSIEGYFEITEIGNSHISGIFQAELLHKSGQDYAHIERVKITSGKFTVPIPPR